jgi:hypothetical protein
MLFTAPSWDVDALKLVAEYMRDVILFEQMAGREANPELKEALERQAKAYRKLADEPHSSGTATVTLSRADSDATKFGYARFSWFLHPALKKFAA